jgi:diketogulonate reductase-like aldo/keto reductase
MGRVLNITCGLLRFLFTRFLPFIVLLLALFIGWLNNTSIEDNIPVEARLFVFLIPLLKGLLPPILIGHGKLPLGKATPPVPDDLSPQSRPTNEVMLELVTSTGTSGNEEDSTPVNYMPQEGIGMCCRPTAYDDVSVERTILWYLLLGGRHIDGAQLYLNHIPIGRGINAAISRGVPRDEIFITTKVWPSHFGYNTTKSLIPAFLKELNVGYIDMVLLHAPVRGTSYFLPKECKELNLTYKQCRQETWKALSELRAEGIIRNVGVSNFAVHQMHDIIELYDNNEDTIIAPISNNQIQWNPWAPKEWVDTVTFCQANNIIITAHNSLGGSLEHHHAETIDILKTLSSKYSRSVSSIMLRWAIQGGAAIIPGTGNPNHMKENLSIYNFELTQDDMQSIENLRYSDDVNSKFKAIFKPLE